MTKTIKFFTLLLLISLSNISFSQSTDKEKAYLKGIEALKLMDMGKLDESIELLEECIKLDPDNSVYPYEIAYANFLKKEYKKTIKILKPLTNRKDASDLFYQLLGNTYSVSGDPKMAIKTYEKGLEKFPNSGKLYLERANMEMMKKSYEKALYYYEKGIEVEPTFPSNYYWASKIYCSSSEEVWGMIYGEIFMNLERNSKRTVEISKMLFNTYKDQIQLLGDTSITVSFSKNAIINITDLTNPADFKLPFGIGVYEPTLLLSINDVKSININSLNKIRTTFVNIYFSNNHDKSYPNILFSYQKQLKEVGHIEAYNYWILMQGDEQEFLNWKNANEEKWEAFVTWFTANPIKIDNNNKFHSSQY